MIVQKCLSRLSKAQREVIELVYHHEKSVEEVAQIVGAPAATVKTRMFYARRRLGDCLTALESAVFIRGLPPDHRGHTSPGQMLDPLLVC